MTMKTKMKALLFAAMFATASLVTQSASAANPVFDVEFDDDGSFSGTLGHTFSAGMQIGTQFSDKFFFDLNSGFNASTSITSSYNVAKSKISDLTITGFNLVRYNPLNDAVLSTFTGVNNTKPVTTLNPHPDDEWSFHADNLTGGSYYIQVLGTINGTGVVSYGGHVSVLAVSAVPEADTYGMMLVGLGALGFVARRKAAKKSA